MENERFELQNVAIPLKWQLPASKCCKLHRKLTEQQMNKNKTKKKQVWSRFYWLSCCLPWQFFSTYSVSFERRWWSKESYVASEHPFLHNYLLPLIACHALSWVVMAHHGLLHFGHIRPRSVLSYRGYTSWSPGFTCVHSSHDPGCLENLGNMSLLF